MDNTRRYMIGVLAFVLLVGSGISVGPAAAEKKFKVLVVPSYEENMPWVQETCQGIESVLGDKAELKYFYMNTKTDFAGGPEKAKQAYALYNEWQPDGVITTEDDAQNMLMIPYFKDKVKTPVFFCGVNADPKKYGYPASNVTGVLERLHMKETITLLQNLNPSLKTIAFMVKKSPIADLLFTQFRNEEKEYTAKIVGYYAPETFQEAKTMAESLKGKTDILFVTTLVGLPDENGKSLTDNEAIPKIYEMYGGIPTTDNVYNVKSNGALCAVVKTGQEQGSTVAKMLLKAMNGTPVSQIPIVQNRYGRKLVNIDVMKTFKISPKPQIMRNVEMVRTEK